MFAFVLETEVGGLDKGRDDEEKGPLADQKVEGVGHLFGRVGILERVQRQDLDKGRASTDHVHQPVGGRLWDGKGDFDGHLEAEEGELPPEFGEESGGRSEEGERRATAGG